MVRRERDTRRHGPAGRAGGARMIAPDRLRVLMVLAEPPLVEGGAEGRCALGRAQGLAAHGADVRILAARQVFSIAGTPPADVDIEVCDVAPPAPGWRTRLDRLRSPHGTLATGAFAARVRDLAREADVVHLEGIDAAAIDVGPRTPSVAQINFLTRHDRSLRGPWNAMWREAVELRLAERRAMRRHRWLAANSSRVAETIRAARPPGEVVVAPLSLDSRYYQPRALDGPPAAGLIGTAAWPPTAEAMWRLLTRVWPRVRRAMPDARLRLAGRRMHAVAAHAPLDGVDVLGDVPSAREFLGALGVLVYPITRGSGMKVKTLEALALGIPIVTTPAGAEGVPPSDGVMVEIGDEALAARTIELLRDARARAERGRAARRTFEASFAPEVATVPLMRVYRRAIEASGR
jgi:glycosyltransferase involved in cell wall biosynthesis